MILMNLCTQSSYTLITGTGTGPLYAQLFIDGSSCTFFGARIGYNSRFYIADQIDVLFDFCQ